LCHDGPNFNDNDFHNLGVQGNNPDAADEYAEQPVVGVTNKEYLKIYNGSMAIGLDCTAAYYGNIMSNH